MVNLTEDPIDSAALVANVAKAECGAINVFLGTVRSVTDSKFTRALNYEAHAELARKQMSRIEEEVRARWDVGDVVMVHRLGVLSVGEVSVGVAVSCPHRGDSFDACRFAIDRLKTDVPIWKQDVAPDGTEAWIHPGVTS